MELTSTIFALKQAFVRFLQNLPFYGSAILCVGRPTVREIMPSVSKPIGLRMREDAMVREPNRRGTACASRPSAKAHADSGDHSHLPGRHNVQNALAAIAVATELGVPDAAIRRRSPNSRSGRRFQRYRRDSLARTAGRQAASRW